MLRMRSAPALLTLITLLSVACDDGSAGGGDAGPADAGEDPVQLYNRLGGKDGITRVIDEFLLFVQSDTRIKASSSTRPSIRTGCAPA